MTRHRTTQNGTTNRNGQAQSKPKRAGTKREGERDERERARASVTALQHSSVTGEAATVERGRGGWARLHADMYVYQGSKGSFCKRVSSSYSGNGHTDTLQGHYRYRYRFYRFFFGLRVLSYSHYRVLSYLPWYGYTALGRCSGVHDEKAPYKRNAHHPVESPDSSSSCAQLALRPMAPL